tara:strand:+ start:7 stop:852 length:846 start_codon:yes stop_codon:yes gene_type:complete
VPLKIIKSITDFTAWRNSVKSKNIGFVPTMGALHLGHSSLIEKSIQNNEITVVSIFVNKLQFGPKEDFHSYPRTLDDDIKILEKMKVDIVFVPTSLELYNTSFSFNVMENNLSTKLEGASRPNFFSGVCTVVLKLFNIVKPSQSFFGKKDIQQLMIIKKMVLDLNLNIDVVGCETIREKSGLALSSRNQYLNTKEKEIASNIIIFLNEAKEMILNKEKYSSVLQCFHNNVKKIDCMKVDYISIASLNTFDELSDEDSIQKNVVVSCAIFLNNVRLIDNIII